MPTFFDHEALTRARTGLELTQEEAASAVGVDVRTWRRYESGEVNDPTAGFEVRNASRRRFIERVKRELGLTERELLVERDSPVEPAGHVLQPARHFVGRAVELDALRAQIADPAVHLVAVIGPGGAGKTALVRELTRGTASSWAWSFYEDPDAEACVAGLDAFRGTIAVLDGLEAVQSEGRGQRSLGELTAPTLRRHLRRVAERGAPWKVVVTSRLPVNDLTPWEGTSVRTLHLGALDDGAVMQLLARHGVRGIDLQNALARTGGHALSLDVLGALTARFLGGDGRRCDTLDVADASHDDPLARRLATMLTRYAEELPAVERDLLARLAVFPRGVTVDALCEIASREELSGALTGLRRSEVARHLARLADQGIVFAQRGGERYAAHPFVSDVFRALGPAKALHEHARGALLATLKNRPGAHATSAEALDGFADLAAHTVGADLGEEAAQVYLRAMGGFAHLGMIRGAFAFALRVLHSLSPERHPTSLARGITPSSALALTYDWALCAVSLGDLSAADAALREHDRLARSLGARGRLLVLARARAHLARVAGRFDEAMAFAEESIARAQSLDSYADEARGHAMTAVIHHARGELDAAVTCFARAAALGDAPSARRGLWEAAVILEGGGVERARAIVDAVKVDMAQRGWRGHAAEADVLSAEVALRTGDLDRARIDLDAALAVANETHDAELGVRALSAASRLARGRGDRDEAARLSREARERVEELGLHGLARVLPTQG